MAAVRVGVLGGTFDPPHLGHLLLAEQAYEQLSLERVLWVPAGDPWRKAGTSVSAAEHRLAMLQLAIEDNPKFDVDARETVREGPSYTVDTLASLRTELPTQELIFLVGLDALLDLPQWRSAGSIVELALLGVAARGGEHVSADELDSLFPRLSDRVVRFEMPRIDVSATDLRIRASTGRSIRYLVSPAVEAYIYRHNLYQSQ